jgi:hypothetical protein
MFLAQYTWKVGEKEIKMVFMMNKLAMINYCEIILKILVSYPSGKHLKLGSLLATLYLTNGPHKLK